jgi:two-component system response regulator HydG
MRPTDLLGLIFGRFVELATRPEDAPEAKLNLRQCADLLAEIVNSRGARFSVGTVAEGSIQLFTRDCPFTDGATDAPHLCEVAIGAMGTLAARNLGYGKVELRQRMTTGDCCEIWIHTDALRAAPHPGCVYSMVRSASSLAGSSRRAMPMRPPVRFGRSRWRREPRR